MHFPRHQLVLLLPLLIPSTSSSSYPPFLYPTFQFFIPLPPVFLSYSSNAFPASLPPNMLFLSLFFIFSFACLSFLSYASPVSLSLGGNGASPDNLLALAVIAARERASLGEISFALETEWGRHVATTLSLESEGYFPQGGSLSCSDDSEGQ